MSAHTPGPWRAQRWMEEHAHARLFGANGERIATFHDVREQGPANLALAAAAPDLLAALSDLMGLCHGEPEYDDAIECPHIRASVKHARAAIARAEGA